MLDPSSASPRTVPPPRIHPRRPDGAGLAPEGRPFIWTGCIAGGLFLLAGWSVPGWLLLGFGLFSIVFFRDPDRRPPDGEGLAVAPADGKVIVVERAFEPHILRREALHIGIFLNIFDVHVNRMPVGGTVREVIYQPGRFISATRDKAAEVNEKNHVVIEMEGPDGTVHPVLVTQIAGLIARRIVSDPEVGDRYERGERFGLIRFGSRTDVWLPVEMKPLVSPGDRVKGGETIVGRFDVA